MAIAWPLLLALTFGAPAEFEYEPPMLFNRLSSPWLSLSLTAGGTFIPFWDVSFRPRFAVGLLWDAIELGGNAIVGFNFVQRFAGGGVFVNWTPVPYRLGQIFYTHVGIGRYHTDDPYLGKRHVDFMQFSLGFRIARNPREKLFVPFVEIGYEYRQRCGDWAAPCSFDDRAWWAPWFEAGVRFR